MGRSAAKRVWLAGTARSGTTWLSNVLAIRGTEQVFEPLSPRQMHLPSDLEPTVDRWSRPYLRPDDDAPGWQHFVERLYRGEIRNRWTRFGHHPWHLRPGLLLRSLRPERVLVKAIRSNLLLGWLARRPALRVVHVLRHPCATLHSMRRKNMPLELDPLLDDRRLCDDHLTPFEGYLRTQLETPLQRLAACWAIENLVPLRQAASEPILVLTYESMLRDPHLALERVVAHLDWQPSAADWRRIDRRLQQPVSGLPAATDAETLLSRWRTQMSPADIHTVLDVCHRLDVHLYSDAPLPDETALPVG